MNRLLTTGQVAVEVGVSAVTVWRWAKDGRIRAIRLPSRRFLVPRSEVARIIGEEPNPGDAT